MILKFHQKCQKWRILVKMTLYTSDVILSKSDVIYVIYCINFFYSFLSLVHLFISLLSQKFSCRSEKRDIYGDIQNIVKLFLRIFHSVREQIFFTGIFEFRRNWLRKYMFRNSKNKQKKISKKTCKHEHFYLKERRARTRKNEESKKSM